jgi:large subunit ribosomal protein L25
MQEIHCYAKSDKAEKLIPAVLYSEKNKSISFNVSVDVIFKLIHDGAVTTNKMILNIDNKKHEVLIYDIQLNPINEQPIHVDFLPILKNKEQTVKVPLVILNKELSPGIKRGGNLFTLRRYLKLKGDLRNLPRVFTYDASKLNIGDKIKISDLNPYEGFVFVDKSDVLILNLSGKKKKLSEEEVGDNNDENSN